MSELLRDAFAIGREQDVNGPTQNAGEQRAGSLIQLEQVLKRDSGVTENKNRYDQNFHSGAIVSLRSRSVLKESQKPVLLKANNSLARETKDVFR
jgi:hypothetical protein